MRLLGDSGVIDWIGEYARAWGDCTVWIRSRKDGNYPKMDVSARMADGGMSQNQGTLRQHFPEVRVRESLAVHRVLLTPPLMSFEARMCFDVHYTDRRPQRYRIREVCELVRREVGVSEYFARLNESHYHLNARIEPIGEKPLRVETASRKQPVTHLTRAKCAS